MINVLYVGGKEVSIPELQGKNVHVDYVQNGMHHSHLLELRSLDICDQMHGLVADERAHLLVNVAIWIPAKERDEGLVAAHVGKNPDLFL